MSQHLLRERRDDGGVNEVPSKGASCTNHRVHVGVVRSMARVWKRSLLPSCAAVLLPKCIDHIADVIVLTPAPAAALAARCVLPAAVERGPTRCAIVLRVVALPGAGTNAQIQSKPQACCKLLV